ncbi:MAG: hypothetical protein MZU97_12985 [Bacillus subtilis]|nr:hypothetical protein [Bacillus subtilis]
MAVYFGPPCPSSRDFADDHDRRIDQGACLRRARRGRFSVVATVDVTASAAAWIRHLKR